jgi:protein SCO1/2
VTLAATILAGCGSGSTTSSAAGANATSSSGFDGAALPPGQAAPGFTLTDQRGERVSLAGYRGRVVVLAFIYSTCGRPCVLLAQQVRGALDELPHPVPVLFVSADPAIDTRASVARFLASVSLTGRVRYLTGSLGELRPVWRAYGVTPPEAGRAAFQNAVGLRLIDRRGDDRVLFQVEGEDLTVEGIAHDLRRLGAT